MKFRVLLGGMIMAGAVVAFAQTNPPAATPSVPGTPAPAPKADVTNTTPPTAPANPADAKAKADAKKKEDAKKKAAKEEPPIDGIVIARGASGNQIGFKIKGNVFVLTFYDAKRKKIAVDVARGAIRWKNKFDPGSDHAVLMPAGSDLTSDKVVPPPHNLKFFLSLYVEGQDTPVESYTVDYHD